MSSSAGTVGAVAVSAVLAPSLLLPGIALLLRGRATVAASLMATCGLGVVAAALAETDGHPALALRLTLVVGTLLAPLMVLSYPWPRWEHPADLLALIASVAAGALAVARPDDASDMLPVLFLVVTVHGVWSLLRSTGDERRTRTWLAVSVVGSTLVAGTLSFALEAGLGTSWAALAFSVVGPAMLVGATRPDLTDPRSVVIEVTATLTTMLAVVAVFVGIAAPLLESLDLHVTSLATSLLALVAGGLAAAYGPVRRELRGMVAGLLLGRRLDPLSALDHVSRGLGAHPSEALDAVREGLGLPWAAVGLDPPLTSGTRPVDVVLVPLGVGLPDLEVGLRHEETRLSRDDERVLALAAPLLGQAIRLHLLGAQMSASREQTVRAVEEERLRLRRDLHDGLGPVLSGLAFTGDAAGNLLSSDPGAAATLVDAMRQQARDALTDVRRLVYGMRPPALDELGLVPAIAQAAGELYPRRAAQLEVVADELPPLPAAVEVAAYRIAVEALTNAARHAPQARVRAVVEVRDQDLVVQVTDATGSPEGVAEWRPGVGVTSMRERAEELGGSLTAGPTADGGRVRAVLPLGEVERVQVAASS